MSLFLIHIVCEIEAIDSSWLSCLLSQIKKCSPSNAHYSLRLFTAKFVYDRKLNKHHGLTHGHYSYLAGPVFLIEKTSLEKHLRYSIFLDIKKVLCFRSSIGQKVQELSREFGVKSSYSMPKIVTKLVMVCKQFNINIIRGKKIMILYICTNIPAEFDWLIIAASKL